MEDNPGLEARILKYLKKCDASGVRLSKMQKEAFPDADIEEIVVQTELTIDRGLLRASIERFIGGDGYINRPVVIATRHEFPNKGVRYNKPGRWLLQNAPNLLALWKLLKPLFVFFVIGLAILIFYLLN